jgi:hypothetical protein
VFLPILSFRQRIFWRLIQLNRIKSVLLKFGIGHACQKRLNLLKLLIRLNANSLFLTFDLQMHFACCLPNAALFTFFELEKAHVPIRFRANSYTFFKSSIKPHVEHVFRLFQPIWLITVELSLKRFVALLFMIHFRSLEQQHNLCV